MDLEGRLKERLEASFIEEGLEDCFLLEIKISANKKVQVFIDSTEGVSFDKCRRLSRALEKEIDENGWLGEKYVLEVSSAGIDRPLTDLRQYPKNVGRNVEVILKDQSKWKGLFKAFSDDAVTLEYQSVRKEGKKKIKEQLEKIIGLDEIDEIKVKVKF